MQPIRILITPPTQDVVSLDSANQQLRLGETDDDNLVEIYLAAAVNRLDPAGGGFLGRALRPQTWEYRLCGFPSCPIELPYPPLIAIASVKYDDNSGVEQTLVAGTDYQVVGAGGKDAAHLVPAYGKSWPTARSYPESVRIRYSCGYPLADPDPLPAPLVQAILLMTGNWYQNREAVVTGTIVAPLPFGVDALLANYREYGP